MFRKVLCFLTVIACTFTAANAGSDYALEIARNLVGGQRMTAINLPTFFMPPKTFSMSNPWMPITPRPTTVRIGEKIPTTKYVSDYLRQYCKNNGLDFQGVSSRKLATEKYILSAIDEINTDTNYADSARNNKLVSVSYLKNITRKLKISEFCNATGTSGHHPHKPCHDGATWNNAQRTCVCPSSFAEYVDNKCVPDSDTIALQNLLNTYETELSTCTDHTLGCYAMVEHLRDLRIDLNNCVQNDKSPTCSTITRTITAFTDHVQKYQGCHADHKDLVYDRQNDNITCTKCLTGYIDIERNGTCVAIMGPDGVGTYAATRSYLSQNGYNICEGLATNAFTHENLIECGTAAEIKVFCDAHNEWLAYSGDTTNINNSDALKALTTMATEYQKLKKYESTCRYIETPTTCPSGQYLGDKTCKTCDAGYMCAGGTAQPVACTSGKYQDQPGQSSCKSCPSLDLLPNGDWKYSNNQPSTNVTMCTAVVTGPGDTNCNVLGGNATATNATQWQLSDYMGYANNGDIWDADLQKCVTPGGTVDPDPSSCPDDARPADNGIGCVCNGHENLVTFNSLSTKCELTSAGTTAQGQLTYVNTYTSCAESDPQCDIASRHTTLSNTFATCKTNGNASGCDTIISDINTLNTHAGNWYACHYMLGQQFDWTTKTCTNVCREDFLGDAETGCRSIYTLLPDWYNHDIAATWTDVTEFNRLNDQCPSADEVDAYKTARENVNNILGSDLDDLDPDTLGGDAKYAVRTFITTHDNMWKYSSCEICSSDTYALPRTADQDGERECVQFWGNNGALAIAYNNKHTYICDAPNDTEGCPALNDSATQKYCDSFDVVRDVLADTPDIYQGLFNETQLQSAYDFAFLGTAFTYGYPDCDPTPTCTDNQLLYNGTCTDILGNNGLGAIAARKWIGDSGICDGITSGVIKPNSLKECPDYSIVSEYCTAHQEWINQGNGAYSEDQLSPLTTMAQIYIEYGATYESCETCNVGEIWNGTICITKCEDDQYIDPISGLCTCNNPFKTVVDGVCTINNETYNRVGGQIETIKTICAECNDADWCSTHCDNYTNLISTLRDCVDDIHDGDYCRTFISDVDTTLYTLNNAAASGCINAGGNYDTESNTCCYDGAKYENDACTCMTNDGTERNPFAVYNAYDNTCSTDPAAYFIQESLSTTWDGYCDEDSKHPDCATECAFINQYNDDLTTYINGTPYDGTLDNFRTVAEKAITNVEKCMYQVDLSDQLWKMSSKCTSYKDSCDTPCGEITDLRTQLNDGGDLDELNTAIDALNTRINACTTCVDNGNRYNEDGTCVPTCNSFQTLEGDKCVTSDEATQLKTNLNNAYEDCYINQNLYDSGCINTCDDINALRNDIDNRINGYNTEDNYDTTLTQYENLTDVLGLCRECRDQDDVYSENTGQCLYGEFPEDIYNEYCNDYLYANSDRCAEYIFLDEEGKTSQEYCDALRDEWGTVDTASNQTLLSNVVDSYKMCHTILEDNGDCEPLYAYGYAGADTVPECTPLTDNAGPDEWATTADNRFGEIIHDIAWRGAQETYVDCPSQAEITPYYSSYSKLDGQTLNIEDEENYKTILRAPATLQHIKTMVSEYMRLYETYPDCRYQAQCNDYQYWDVEDEQCTTKPDIADLIAKVTTAKANTDIISKDYNDECQAEKDALINWGGKLNDAVNGKDVGDTYDTLISAADAAADAGNACYNCIAKYPGFSGWENGICNPKAPSIELYSRLDDVYVNRCGDSDVDAKCGTTVCVAAKSPYNFINAVLTDDTNYTGDTYTFDQLLVLTGKLETNLNTCVSCTERYSEMANGTGYCHPKDTSLNAMGGYTCINPDGSTNNFKQWNGDMDSPACVETNAVGVIRANLEELDSNLDACESLNAVYKDQNKDAPGCMTLVDQVAEQNTTLNKCIGDSTQNGCSSIGANITTLFDNVDAWMICHASHRDYNPTTGRCTETCLDGTMVDGNDTCQCPMFYEYDTNGQCVAKSNLSKDDATDYCNWLNGYSSICSTGFGVDDSLLCGTNFTDTTYPDNTALAKALTDIYNGYNICRNALITELNTTKENAEGYVTWCDNNGAGSGCAAPCTDMQRTYYDTIVSTTVDTLENGDNFETFTKNVGNLVASVNMCQKCDTANLPYDNDNNTCSCESEYQSFNAREQRCELKYDIVNSTATPTLTKTKCNLMQESLYCDAADVDATCSQDNLDAFLTPGVGDKLTILTNIDKLYATCSWPDVTVEGYCVEMMAADTCSYDTVMNCCGSGGNKDHLNSPDYDINELMSGVRDAAAACLKSQQAQCNDGATAVGSHCDCGQYMDYVNKTCVIDSAYVGDTIHTDTYTQCDYLENNLASCSNITNTIGCNSKFDNWGNMSTQNRHNLVLEIDDGYTECKESITSACTSIGGRWSNDKCTCPTYYVQSGAGCIPDPKYVGATIPSITTEKCSYIDTNCPTLHGVCEGGDLDNWFNASASERIQLLKNIDTNYKTCIK